MHGELKEGLLFEFVYTVPENKTVPDLYPEAEEFHLMPKVFATGFMVGLFEWACIRAIKPYSGNLFTKMGCFGKLCQWNSQC